MFINTSEKKTLEISYLTVEQVRRGANAWLLAQTLPSPARSYIYQQTAALITYHQRRNRQARLSHTKRTIQSLQKMGIEVDQLNSCIPDNP